MSLAPTRAQVERSWPFLLPSGYFVLHTLEELPRFAAWASRHFGELSSLAFASTHVPMILLVFVVSLRAVQRERHGGWVVLAAAAAVQFGLKAVFHLATAVGFGEYSPGMVTAACLGLPGSVLLLRWVRRQQRLTPRELAAAVVLGTTVAAAAVGVLFLH